MLLPALSFALLYFPALTRLAPPLDSPYPKVHWRRRLVAGAVDASLVGLAIYFFVHDGSMAFLTVGAAYVIVRDGIAGRSVGKFFTGLSVVELQTGRACSFSSSVIRNLVFLLPGVNVVALPLEAVTVARDAHGQRLGDRWARTQVVEGFGARDVAGSFSSWWPTPTWVRGRRRPLPGAPPASS